MNEIISDILRFGFEELTSHTYYIRALSICVLNPGWLIVVPES